ncbi:MAG: NADH-quinone oxidoreductase subunit L [Egibacteraceae bacterium]
MPEVLPAPPGSPVALAWLIPLVPAISAGLLMMFGKRLGKLSGPIAVLAVGFSATMATAVFAFLHSQPPDARVFTHTVSSWVSAGSLQVDWAVLIDPLATVMLLLVGWVGLLIHVYSLGYMEGDPRYHLFFAYLNLFAAAMLVLVTGANFLVLFVGWELVGLCSYLLIGFWFEHRDYASAAKKAFVVNRVGDVGFMIAMFLIFATFSSLEFAAVLPRTGEAAAGTLVAIGLLLFVGAAGKSAQIPLYVWLPDAMAGPTPVSALIHAATMVTAGVYLVARTSPLYAAIPDVGLLIAWIGGLTALVTAIIACAQVDLKKILAYSTISQLGYMFIAVGVGAYTAGIFHLLTHGFFKALLFLCAGAVMHALGEETDVRRMGGLWSKMPVTGTTALLGTAAIAGLPFLSGFYSKEEILAAAAETSGGQAIWLLGVLVAGLTAFYMTRWFVLIFLGPARWPEGAHPHEAPLSMTVPLALLAVGSVAGGLINLNPESGFLHRWLEPSVVAFEPSTEFLTHTLLVAAAVVAALAGIAAGFALYRRVDVATIGVGNGLRGAARERFHVDEFYERTIAGPGRLLAVGFSWFDQEVIDGAVNGVARLTGALGGVGRRVQTGFVRSYALAVLAGAVLIAALFIGAVR